MLNDVRIDSIKTLKYLQLNKIFNKFEIEKIIPFKQLNYLKMKKIITSIVLTITGLFVFGQSPVVLNKYTGADISGTIYDEYAAGNSSILTEFLLHNSDSVSHTYKCRRFIYTVAPDDSTQFCWGGLCYNWGTNLSSVSQNIVAGDTINFAGYGFKAIFNTKMSTMTRYVHYQFYDVANPSDSTGVTIRYNSTVGVNETDKIGGSLSNAFPNPTNEVVSMKYELKEYSQKGSVVIYDMLGKVQKEMILNDKKGTAKIDVSELNPGIYFYSFLVDGKAISTKKLVVSSK